MKFVILLILIVLTTPTFADDQLNKTQSQHSVKETADRFVKLIENKGLTLFARIDHAANAAVVDLTLPATELILFGNPSVGTKLMQCAPTVAIDLPQKVLVWEDTDKKVWLAYPNPAYLKELHLIEGCDPVLEKITTLLANLAALTTAR